MGQKRELGMSPCLADQAVAYLRLSCPTGSHAYNIGAVQGLVRYLIQQALGPLLLLHHQILGTPDLASQAAHLGAKHLKFTGACAAQTPKRSMQKGINMGISSDTGPPLHVWKTVQSMQKQVYALCKGDATQQRTPGRRLHQAGKA